MPKLVNHGQIRVMAQFGAPILIIADRLGCSTKTVRRILKGYEIVPLRTSESIFGTTDEPFFWRTLRDRFTSYSTIGWISGFSKQHIHEVLASRLLPDSDLSADGIDRIRQTQKFLQGQQFEIQENRNV